MSGITFSPEMLARLQAGELHRDAVLQATNALIHLVQSEHYTDADTLGYISHLVKNGADINYITEKGYKTDILRGLLEARKPQSLRCALELGARPMTDWHYFLGVFNAENIWHRAEAEAMFYVLMDHGMGHIAGLDHDENGKGFLTPHAKRPYYILDHKGNTFNVVHTHTGDSEEVHSDMQYVWDRIGIGTINDLKQQCDDVATKVLEGKKDITSDDLVKLYIGMWHEEPEVMTALLNEPAQLLNAMNEVSPLVHEGYMAMMPAITSSVASKLIEGPVKDWSVIETSLQEREAAR